MQPADTIRALKEFCATHFQGYDLKNDEEIFSLGFVSSMFAMQLVEFVESEFQIDVESEDLEIENFSTLNAIAHLVARKARDPRAA